MATRSKILVPPTVLPNADTVLYTVPLGETGLVKWLSVVNVHTAAVTVALYLNGFAAGVSMMFRPFAAALDVQVPVFWPLGPGDALHGWASVGAKVTISAHGAELQGVA